MKLSPEGQLSDIFIGIFRAMYEMIERSLCQM